MLRNFWIAVGGLLWSTSLALAQPGYPMAPYGMPPMNPAPMPPNGAMVPYGMPMNPGAMPPNPMMPGMPMPYARPPMPYGYPQPYGMPASRPLTAPIPPDPRRPVPIHEEAGPMKGATGPYLVGPGSDKAPAAPPAKTPPPVAQPVVPTPAGPAQVYDPAIEMADFGPTTAPAEPYTLYEGRRYLAEVKNDDVVVFGSVSYIHWWTRRDQVTPLVTTGPGANLAAGTLGDPTTQTLIGGGRVAPNEFSGLQANFGLWLDPDHLTALEFGGFYVGKNSRQYAIASDAGGSPVITRPINTGGEAVHIVAAPGVATGNILVNSIMNFNGAEANVSRNLIRLNGFSLDYLVGLRYVYLNDSLTITENSTLLPGGALSFLGVPQPVGATFSFYDFLNTTNRFYGGQIGLRANFVHCNKFDIGGTFKLALGATTHTTNIDGYTSVGTNTATGGVLAQTSNIGNHNTSDFSVIPEASFTVGYQIHPNIRLFTGYTLLYWTQVVRASEQIDRTIDPGIAPTDPAFAPAAAPGLNPRFVNNRTDFWAQGINVGIEVKY